MFYLCVARKNVSRVNSRLFLTFHVFSPRERKKNNGVLTAEMLHFVSSLSP